MKYLCILLLAALPSSLYSQSSMSEKWNTVEKVCGRVTEFQITKKAWSASFGPEIGKKAEVLLYRRLGQKKCCAQDSLVAEVQKADDGRFEFKGAVPGRYWLATVVGKKNYRLPVTLNPSIGDWADCSDIVYQIREGDQKLIRMIRTS